MNLSAKILIIRLISEKIDIANYRLAYTYGVLIFENDRLEERNAKVRGLAYDC